MLCAWQAAQNQQGLCVLQIQELFWGHLPIAARLHRLMQLQLLPCPSRSASSTASQNHAVFACKRSESGGSVCTCLLPSLSTSKFDLVEYSSRQYWYCLTQSNFGDAEPLVLTQRLDFCVTGNSQIAFNGRNSARLRWHYFACL